MARFYVAGPLFSAQDRAQLETIDGVLRDGGHATFLPHRDGADEGASRGPEGEGADVRRRRIFEADLSGLARADAVVALLDGPDCDAGTAFEVGWAYASRRPALGVRTDFRTLGPEGPVSLMVHAACERFVDASRLTWEDAARQIQAWAAGVKPFGGRLVRDGVPRLAREQGHALRFRRAEEGERAVALKARVRESAHELECAGVADEPEALADLLEAAEALIRARGLDRATLRAVKEAKWKAKGGYDEAWVVDH